MNEKSNLCFSKRDLHTLEYREYVKYAFKESILCSMNSDLSEFSIDNIKSYINHDNEY